MSARLSARSRSCVPGSSRPSPTDPGPCPRSRWRSMHPPTRSSSGSWACAATAGWPRSRARPWTATSSTRRRDGCRDGTLPSHPAPDGRAQAKGSPRMTAQVDVGLYGELQKFGAADVSACFSCGTCTASCPLVTEDATFPRRMIRYAQVGLRDKLLSSKELWTCYACGECSETCPTQAEPSEFMAAARRYAIGSYDRTGLARTMYTRPVLGTVIAVFLAAGHALPAGGSLDLFGFVPEDLIHTLGIVVMAIVVLAGLAGIITMARQVGRAIVM